MSEKFWESDPAAVELMSQAWHAEQVAEESKKLAKALREQAAARMRDIVPSPEKICADAEAVDVYKIIGEGLYHWTRREQPADARLNHHSAFGVQVTDWLRLDYTLCTPQGPRPTLKPGYDFVRVGLKVRECFDPTYNGRYLTGFPDNWKDRLEKWVKDACEAVRIRTRDYDLYGDWSGPLDAWGGGEWASLVAVGPVHPSYLKAADNARREPFGKAGWGKIIPPAPSGGLRKKFVWEVG